MEVSIVLNGEEKKINLRSPTGEEEDEYFNRLADIQGDEKESVGKLNEFRLYRKELLLKLEGGKNFKSLEDLNKLSKDELEKMHKAVEAKFFAFKEVFLQN